MREMITIKPNDIGADPIKESMWVWGLDTTSRIRYRRRIGLVVISVSSKVKQIEKQIRDVS